MEHREDRILEIPIDHIDIHPAFETRFHWTPEGDRDLQNLTESLKSEGQIAPIIVTTLPEATAFGKTYTLIAGRRRLEAVRLQKRSTIQARILPPARLDDPATRLRLFAITVAENIHRKNLTSEERREALHRLRQYYDEVHPRQRKSATLPGAQSVALQPPSFTEWAAEQFHISRSAVSKDLRLVQLAHRVPAVSDKKPELPPNAPPMRKTQPDTQSSQEKSAEKDPLITQLQRVTAGLRELLSLLSQEDKAQLPAAECTAFQKALEAALVLFANLDSEKRSQDPCTDEESKRRLSNGPRSS
jgi:ParB/RepB/Spo0J family partition protein